MTKYIHLAQDYRGIDGRIIHPDDSVRFCHLRDANFKGVDLTGVEFLGCRFNGASFIEADLTDAKFIGCFIGDDYDPMYLEEETASKASFIDCYLPYHAVLGSMTEPKHWSKDTVNAATKMFSPNNGMRNDGVKALKEIDNPIVAPFLASCLIDGEWDVVQLTLEALISLRHESFPHHDREILGWMMFCLGHEHSVVRDEMVDIVERLKPDDELLIPVLNQIKSIKPSKQLAGLRSAYKLYRLDLNYLRLLDVSRLNELFYSPCSEVHDECSKLLYTMDVPLPTRT
jgi:Pentapeptide repeats (8 copies)